MTESGAWAAMTLLCAKIHSSPPHLAAPNAPRKVVISGGTASGKALEPKGVEEAFAFTRKVYRFHKADAALTIRGKLEAAALVKLL